MARMKWGRNLSWQFVDCTRELGMCGGSMWLRFCTLQQLSRYYVIESYNLDHEFIVLDKVYQFNVEQISMAFTVKNFHVFLLVLLPLLVSCDEKQVYIVYLGEHSGEKTHNEIEENHYSYLFSVKETVEDAKSSLLYSYKSSINGFAALLTPDEASKLSEIEEVLSVLRSQSTKYSLQTTRSWEFSGLQQGGTGFQLKKDLLLESSYGRNVIVGMLDSGIWPESKSFSDEGMGPYPSSWKGICQSGDEFNSSNCNMKIIGARYYIKGYEAQYGPLDRTLDSLSPRDKDGHGTHTASTVGGRRVQNVSALGGFARGTASGGAPLVRLAIYKVCWAIPDQGKEEGNACFMEDILAAMDDAIGDGVDVLSMSIGTNRPVPFYEDSIAIGALHAIKKNIVVACSAGNSGPAPATLSNTAPWIITVGASSIDRKFLAPIVLGNGMKIEGQTITPYNLEKKMYQLVYAAQIVNADVPKDTSGQCLPGSLSPEAAKGKIVLCLRGNGTRLNKGLEVKRAGGIGFILGNRREDGVIPPVDAHFLPATGVNYENALKILNYINSTKTPMAYIVPATTELDSKPAPFMASFTSRGPSPVSPNILKPDITAPGLYILAAWSEASSLTKLANDPRMVKYNILSGTSMSCPHIGAASALLKAIHPTWSSAAIRSALITTAELNDNLGNPITDEKIIGARYYIKGYEAQYGPLDRTLDSLSPRDKDGHGTHTASTVGGRRVQNVSALGGFARGTASGGAPLVRLAIYKVCWAIPDQGKEEGNTCFMEDILAAMDDAIGDGVDVLSMSIGTNRPVPFYEDSIAIGALHAIKKNIVVACSAGNSGPAPATLSNTAPWIITVGASSIDRKFLAPIVLGNGMKIEGQTITPYNLEKKMYQLVYAAQIVNADVPKDTSGQCLPGSLSPEAAKGKIVLCLRGNGTRLNKGLEVKRAGGIGFILGNRREDGVIPPVDAHFLPATGVNYENALKILNYINSTKTPMAYIVPATTELDSKPAPFMASFTSRGPSPVSPNILKPDITAPGLYILAAWSEASSLTKLANDPRMVKYNILSGTSMSCPHIGAASALLKAIHPTWSSAAIRSALITTAELNDNLGNPITDEFGKTADPFQFGSGHFRPTKAADPGLVYDASYTDYLLFLCSIGITNLDSSFKCPIKPPSPSNLNYPSLAIPELNGTTTVERKVTNVGGSKSVYFIKVKPPPGFLVTVSPSILFFNQVGEMKTFTITVKASSVNKGMEKDKYAFGWYTWFDGIHSVQSPIAVSLA
ncbi:subtilisin-like protease SBT5.6 [Olea europaea var. sylvestris]|uniref:subtilisin-like protease SBT5.6 n=1 Tax=Olea europaea var. sylvestris TaxID=158386 RepID=UPI000C1CD23F|nr:subtilisin-like protease SBT5.6 [Olea europaea var. sylvestris]